MGRGSYSKVRIWFEVDEGYLWVGYGRLMYVLEKKKIVVGRVCKGRRRVWKGREWKGMGRYEKVWVGYGNVWVWKGELIL